MTTVIVCTARDRQGVEYTAVEFTPCKLPVAIDSDSSPVELLRRHGQATAIIHGLPQSIPDLQVVDLQAAVDARLGFSPILSTWVDGVDIGPDWLRVDGAYALFNTRRHWLMRQEGANAYRLEVLSGRAKGMQVYINHPSVLEDLADTNANTVSSPLVGMLFRSSAGNVIEYRELASNEPWAPASDSLLKTVESTVDPCLVNRLAVKTDNPGLARENVDMSDRPLSDPYIFMQ